MKRLGVEWLGSVLRGSERHGRGWLSSGQHLTGCCPVVFHQGLGAARQGLVGLGAERHGMAWQCKVLFQETIQCKTSH